MANYNNSGPEYPKVKITRVSNAFQVVARGETVAFKFNEVDDMSSFLKTWADEQVAAKLNSKDEDREKV